MITDRVPCRKFTREVPLWIEFTTIVVVLMCTKNSSLPAFENGAPGQVCGKPSDREVKVLCKAAAGVSPWDICDEDTVDRAIDTVGMALNLNKDSAPVRPPPQAGECALGIVILTVLMAEGAVILMPSVWSGPDPDMCSTFLVRVENNIFYHNTLDI